MEAYKFTPEQIAEIEAAYSAATDAKVGRRLKMLVLRARGESSKNVAEAAGVERTTVNRLVSEYRDKGLEAVIRKSAKCRRCGRSNTPAQTAALKSMLDSTTCKQTARRVRALLLWTEGKSHEDIAAATGLSESYIRQLIMKFRDNGVVGIEKKHRKRSFAAPKYKFTDQQKAEIGAMRGLVTDRREASRLEALWLRTEKKSLLEISAMTGIYREMVYRIIKRYHEQGLEAAIKPHRGRHAKISIRYKEKKAD